MCWSTACTLCVFNCSLAYLHHLASLTIPSILPHLASHISSLSPIHPHGPSLSVFFFFLHGCFCLPTCHCWSAHSLHSAGTSERTLKWYREKHTLTAIPPWLSSSKADLERKPAHHFFTSSHFPFLVSLSHTHMHILRRRGKKCCIARLKWKAMHLKFGVGLHFDANVKRGALTKWIVFRGLIYARRRNCSSL